MPEVSRGRWASQKKCREIVLNILLQFLADARKQQTCNLMQDFLKFETRMARPGEGIGKLKRIKNKGPRK